MNSIDLDVLQTCDRWLKNGISCQLVTVVRTWGSSPRPAGAMMAMRTGGAVVGSVSGGCIEDDMIADVQQNGIDKTGPRLVTYGIRAEDAHRFGIPCGGTIELVVEPLCPSSRIGELLARLRLRETVTRRLDLRSGSVVLRRADADHAPVHDTRFVSTVMGPQWRLIIIGAGQLSQFLARIALALDYDVTVCDPREEYREEWQLPAVRIEHMMPDDLVTAMRMDHRSAVVTLTHDPKLDDLALIEALKSDAFYVGAIGSRANNARRRERLKEFDLDDSQLDRLRGPIGIYIGSKTPHEIAISIMAEITAIKNAVFIGDDLSIGVRKTITDQQRQLVTI